MVHRLVLRAWASRLAVSLVALLAVYAAVGRGGFPPPPGAPPLGRYPLRLPSALSQVLPVALAAAGCWAGVHLSRTGQLVALAAVGADPRRALLSVPVAGLLAGALVLANAEEVAPRCLALWRGAGEVEVEARRGGWSASGSRLIWLADPASTGGSGEGRGAGPAALVFELDERGLPRSRLEAARVLLDRGELELGDVLVWRAGQPAEALPSLTLPAPAVEAVRVRPVEELPAGALDAAARASRAAGLDPSPALAERGLRVALGLACPLTALLGILAGAALGRRPGLAAAAAAGVALACWAAIATSWSLASTGAAPWQAVAAAPPLLLVLPAAAGWMAGLPRPA